MVPVLVTSDIGPATTATDPSSAVAIVPLLKTLPDCQISTADVYPPPLVMVPAFSRVAKTLTRTPCSPSWVGTTVPPASILPYWPGNTVCEPTVCPLWITNPSARAVGAATQEVNRSPVRTGWSARWRMLACDAMTNTLYADARVMADHAVVSLTSGIRMGVFLRCGEATQLRE